MGFDNILMTLAQTPQNAQVDDYQLFDKLRREGRSLQEIVKQADEAEALRKRVDELSRRPPVDEEVFPVMESAVRDDPEVTAARDALSRARSNVISAILMRDPAFKEAFDNYRQVVRCRYVSKMEAGGGTVTTQGPEMSPGADVPTERYPDVVPSISNMPQPMTDI